MNQMSLVFGFAVSLSIVSCKETNEEEVKREQSILLSVSAEGQAISSDKATNFKAREIKVRFESFAKPENNLTVKITKDSDPDYLVDISKRLRDPNNKGVVTVPMTVGLWEGQNTFTVVAEQLTDGQGLSAKYILEVRSPEKAKISDMKVLNQDKRSRLEIPLRFGKKIRQLFELSPQRKAFLEGAITADKKPDIYIIFIDTLRRDVLRAHGPNFQRFLDNNVTPKWHWSSGSSTTYTTFSLFSSQPAFLAYKAFKTDLNNASEYGSFPLKVLQKVGYNVNVFGYYWYCLRHDPAFKSGHWPRALQVYFGQYSNLLEKCRLPGHDSLIRQKFNGNWDDEVVTEAKAQITDAINRNPGKPHVFMVTFYNMHNFYRWKDAMLPAPALVPSTNNLEVRDIAGGFKEGNRQKRNFEGVKNSYYNAVAFGDVNFQDLYDFIQSTERGRNAIILLMSDHGESLGEKDFQVSHGYRVYKERIDSVASFKFGKETKHYRAKIKSNIFSTMDIFPTIFSYMKINPSPSTLLVGKSLIDSNQPRQSTISVTTNKEYPTVEMAMMNDKFKIYLKHPTYEIKDSSGKLMDEKIFYEDTDRMTLFDITDLDDKPVFDKPPFSPACNPLNDKWSAAACKELLFKMFPDAFEELIPGVHQK